MRSRRGTASHFCQVFVTHLLPLSRQLAKQQEAAQAAEARAQTLGRERDQLRASEKDLQVSAYIYVYMYVCMYLSIYIYIHIYIYICVYMCICKYIIYINHFHSLYVYLAILSG